MASDYDTKNVALVSLCRLILMKHKRSNLNTLPIIPINMTRVLKRSMRHPPRPTIKLTVKALDQCHLIRSLPILEIPPVLLVRPDSIRLALTIRIDQLDSDKVGVWDRVCVCDCERIAENLLDGTPDVDDLVPGIEQLRLVWEVVSDAVLGCFVGLINVNALDWAT